MGDNLELPFLEGHRPPVLPQHALRLLQGQLQRLLFSDQRRQRTFAQREFVLQSSERFAQIHELVPARHGIRGARFRPPVLKGTPAAHHRPFRRHVHHAGRHGLRHRLQTVHNPHAGEQPVRQRLRGRRRDDVRAQALADARTGRLGRRARGRQESDRSAAVADQRPEHLAGRSVIGDHHRIQPRAQDRLQRHAVGRLNLQVSGERSQNRGGGHPQWIGRIQQLARPVRKVAPLLLVGFQQLNLRPLDGELLAQSGANPLELRHALPGLLLLGTQLGEPVLIRAHLAAQGGQFLLQAVLLALAVRHGTRDLRLFREQAFAPHQVRALATFGLAPLVLQPRQRGIRLQQLRLQRVELPAQEAYQPQPGDEVRPGGKGTTPVWRDGAIVEEAVSLELLRPERAGAKPQKIGVLSGDRRWLLREPRAVGAALDRGLAAEPAAWRVLRGEAPVAVERVHLKSKPNGPRGLSTLHRVYLVLAEPLAAGAGYTVLAHGVSTRQDRIAYRHDTARSRSEVVHASHIGFRPDDPLKHAFVSLWLGGGGGQDYPDDLAFEVLDDATGTVAFTGRAQVAKALGAREQVRGDRDYAGTEVLRLDFSPLARPGRYRVHVPGIGCSAAFPIAADAWLAAARVSLKGLLAHRSGIALGPPLLPYERPRPMHPADGLTVLPVPRTMHDGESEAVREGVRDLLKAGALPDALPEAWGGYMDAGDWDRRSQHLEATGLLLELYGSAPGFWREVRLDLPAEERANRIPDLLDEALWNIDFYGRLQQADGGVRGGVESTEHPRAGEASWQETLVVGAFAADAPSSYRFAATAGEVVRILEVGDGFLGAIALHQPLGVEQAGRPHSRVILDEFLDQHIGGSDAVGIEPGCLWIPGQGRHGGAEPQHLDAIGVVLGQFRQPRLGLIALANFEQVTHDRQPGHQVALALPGIKGKGQDQSLIIHGIAQIHHHPVAYPGQKKHSQIAKQVFQQKEHYDYQRYVPQGTHFTIDLYHMANTSIKPGFELRNAVY